VINECAGLPHTCRSQSPWGSAQLGGIQTFNGSLLMASCVAELDRR